jgi:hypothetical protein
MIENYKTILYRQDDGSWVAEIPAISGCYALMDTHEAAVAELTQVFPTDCRGKSRKRNFSASRYHRDCECLARRRAISSTLRFCSDLPSSVPVAVMSGGSTLRVEL